MSTDQIVATSGGIAFLITILVIAVFIRHPTRFQEFVFRVVLAIAAAAFAAVIPGLLEIDLSAGANASIRAAGALAVFVVVFWLNPTSLVTDTAEEAPLEYDEIRNNLASKLAVLATAFSDPDVERPPGYRADVLIETRKLAIQAFDHEDAPRAIKHHAVLAKIRSGGPDAGAKLPFHDVTPNELEALRRDILRD